MIVYMCLPNLLVSQEEVLMSNVWGYFWLGSFSIDYNKLDSPYFLELTFVVTTYIRLLYLINVLILLLRG